MAIVDLTNLSEILAEKPDVTDASDAIVLPLEYNDDRDVAVEFDNVNFHYPTQPDTKGLKGLSFKMKRGTVTAIVGPTGEGTVAGMIQPSFPYWFGNEFLPTHSSTRVFNFLS
jgi:ATP-binding cassette, subfamily B, heavy metal transporter